MNIQKYKPKERFSERVENYNRHRPGYPRDIIDVFTGKYSLNPNCAIADIGSGTGIFSQLLLENGFKVFSVEPNREMRAYAESNLSKFPGFTSCPGSAEKTTLASNSVEAITVAQAFHWFDIEPTVREFNRILKQNGLVFLIWNERKVDNSRFQKSYEEALIKYCPEYGEIDHRNFTRERIDSIFRDKRINEHHFENQQVFDLESLIGRLESSSYCPGKDHKNYSPLIESIKNIFETYCKDEQVVIEYDCVMYCIY